MPEITNIPHTLIPKTTHSYNDIVLAIIVMKEEDFLSFENLQDPLYGVKKRFFEEAHRTLKVLLCF